MILRTVGHSLELDLSSMLVTWSTTALPCDRRSHVIGIIMDQGCGAVQMPQPEDWALSTFLRFWHWAGLGLSSSKETNTLANMYC